MVPVRVKGFAMDAVEKSFVLGTPGRSGFWFCIRCDVKGKKKNLAGFIFLLKLVILKVVEV